MINTSKMKVYVFILGLMLAVGQGFAANCAANYVPPENLVWDGTSTEEPCTIDGYYIIDNAAKLAWFAAQTNTVDNNQYLSKNAKLMADLDMGGKLWTPIAVGTGNDNKRIYSGIFDGNGHSISNLYISAEELMALHHDSTFYAQNLGFIGCFKGTLKNLNIIDIEVHGFGKGGLNDKNKIVEKPISIGTVVGWQSGNTSSIDGCTASGVVVTSGDGQAVGGIVGNIGGGSISNCVSTVSIKASGLAYVGGIAGYTKKYTGAVTVSSCVYAGTELSAEGSAVVGGKTYNSAAGAIIGHQYQGNVTLSNLYYDSDLFGADGGIGATTKGGSYTTTGSATGVPDVNAEGVVCTLNNGTMVDGECSEDSPWSVGESSVSLNGSDGFTVTFNAKSGAFPDGAKKKKIILKDKIITPEEISAPVHADSAFAGWSLDPEATEPDDDLGSVSGSATVYAVWYPIFTITFSAVPGTYADGETVVKTVKVAKGDMISVTGIEVPTTYVRNDSTLYFTGWSDVQKEFKVDDDIASSDTLHLDGLVATGNMTFYAAWTKAQTFTVTYNANGHGKTKIDFVNVEKGETLTEPPAPTPDNGYEYSGWCEDEKCVKRFDFATKIDQNYVLYADWNAIAYTITYNLDGGTNNAENPATYTIEDASIVFEAPVKEGNNFKGWFYDENFNEIAKQITSGTAGNKVLYAKWEEKTYTIAYMAGSGAVGSISPAQKGYGMSITLADGGYYTRDGYTQDGWATEDGGESVYALGGSYSTNADITLYPHWVQGNVEVSSYGAVTVYTYADSHKEAVINGEYTGEDEYSLDEEISVNSVVLNRSFVQYVPVTLTLPFDIAVENVENAKFYVFGGISVDENGKKAVEANRVKEGTLAANTPYMVVPTGTSILFNGSVTFRETVDPVTTVGTWQFCGTYSYKTVAAENVNSVYGISGSADGNIPQGSFVKFKEGSWFVPMRAYLLNTEVSNRRLARAYSAASVNNSRFEIIWNEGDEETVDEQTTSVRKPVVSSKVVNMRRVYDLKGRQVNGETKVKGAYYNKKVVK